MGDLNQKVKDQLRALKRKNASVFSCLVKEVDKDKRTIKVIDNLQIEYPDVRLKSIIKSGDDVIFYPKKESHVLVAMIGTQENDLIVISYAEVEEIEGKIEDIAFKVNKDGIQLNGDNNSGIVIAPELKKQVDKNSEILDAMLQVYGSSVITEPGQGSPSALQAALKSATSGKTTADLSNIENPKVKHGE